MSGDRALSLRNRLALVFFAITLLAIAVLYLYVAPGLQTRLIDEQARASSAAAARSDSGAISATVGQLDPRCRRSAGSRSSARR